MQEAAAAFFEQIRSAAFHEGRIAGRKEARDELRFFFDKFEETYPIEPIEKRPKRSRGRNGIEEAEPEWLSPDEVEPLVKAALGRLAINHEMGASPQTIAEHLRPEGRPVNVQAVRIALRKLTMTGEARRVAHARYLPAMDLTPIPVPRLDEPQPQEAAE